MQVLSIVFHTWIKLSPIDLNGHIDTILVGRLKETLHRKKKYLTLFSLQTTHTQHYKHGLQTHRYIRRLPLGSIRYWTNILDICKRIKGYVHTHYRRAIGFLWAVKRVIVVPVGVRAVGALTTKFKKYARKIGIDTQSIPPP